MPERFIDTLKWYRRKSIRDFSALATCAALKRNLQSGRADIVTWLSRR